MARREARLQVPIDQAALEELQIRAEELGFQSVPSLVRFWVKGELSDTGRKSTGKGRDWHGLSEPNAQVLRYVELILALNPGQPKSAEAALEYLMRQMRRASFKKFFHDFPGRETSDTIFNT
jgi:hypothetical protein